MFKKIFFILILTVGALVYLKASQRPTQQAPYPYINNIGDLTPPEGIESADVLILGDTMGLSLGAYQEILVSVASRGLSGPLKIVNWSWTNEGLHRTLAKLKSLKKLPKVVLYFGGSDELKETPFLSKTMGDILRNFKLYAHPRVATAVTLVPFSSRLIYLSHDLKMIGEFTPSVRERDPEVFQKTLEVHYKLFELELQDFIATVRKAGSTSLLITAPINLEYPPHAVCNNTQSTQTVEFLEQKRAQLKQRRFKEAYTDLKETAQNLIANADAWYLLGMAAKNMGKREEAIEYLKKAQTFDCMPTASGPVFNGIMRKVAKETGTFLIDFEMMLEGQFGRNELFLSERFVHNIYYRALATDTAKVIRQVFDIK